MPEIKPTKYISKLLDNDSCGATFATFAEFELHAFGADAAPQWRAMVTTSGPHMLPTAQHVDVEGAKNALSKYLRAIADALDASSLAVGAP